MVPPFLAKLKAGELACFVESLAAQWSYRPGPGVMHCERLALQDVPSLVSLKPLPSRSRRAGGGCLAARGEGRVATRGRLAWLVGRRSDGAACGGGGKPFDRVSARYSTGRCEVLSCARDSMDRQSVKASRGSRRRLMWGFWTRQCSTLLRCLLLNGCKARPGSHCVRWSRVGRQTPCTFDLVASRSDLRALHAEHLQRITLSFPTRH